MHRSKVWEGHASESLSIQLDPGWYRYKVTAKDEFGEHHQFVNTFFVQITRPMFKEYAALKPALAKVRQLHSGATWFCGYPNCKRTTNNRFAMIDHEKKHMGESIFQNVPWQPTRDGETLMSDGIVILGGPPEGAAEKPEPRKVTLPPAIMGEIEAQRTAAVDQTPYKAPASTERPKRKGGRPKGSKNKVKVEEPVLA